jgi:hypothetical protein
MTNDPLASGGISRRRCLGTTFAALSAGIVSKNGPASGAALGAEDRIPTLDELATGWLDCGQLAHMPSLHNFHEMAACAPDLVGVNFFPGGQLYENSGPRVSDLRAARQEVNAGPCSFRHVRRSSLTFADD